MWAKKRSALKLLVPSSRRFFPHYIQLRTLHISSTRTVYNMYVWSVVCFVGAQIPPLWLMHVVVVRQRLRSTGALKLAFALAPRSKAAPSSHSSRPGRQAKQALHGHAREKRRRSDDSLFRRLRLRGSLLKKPKEKSFELSPNFRLRSERKSA